MAAIFIIGYAPGLNQLKYAPLLSVGIVGALCFYMVLHYQQSLDLVMLTEYQNLLFSQALALGSTFCLFVKRDGTIVYANDGMKTIFPNGSYAHSQALEAVFATGGVSHADRARIMGAVYNNLTDRIVFPIMAADGIEANYILTLEPFVRPSGYILIRGREYREERTGLQIMPNLLRSTSADKLDHLLAHTPVAHYATDAFGRFEYVNQAFEQYLGFEPGEMLRLRLTLAQVLYQIGERTVSDDYSLGDFMGVASWQRKSRDLLETLLFQTTIRDEQGKIIGATGSVVTGTALGQ